MRNEPGVRAVREHRGRARVLRVAQRERLLAQRVVGALRRRDGRIRVAARPGLDAGVEVERGLVPAELDQRDLDTSTDRLSRKSPRPTSGSSTRLKFSRVRGCLTNLMPYSARFAAAAVVGGHDSDAFGG